MVDRMNEPPPPMAEETIELHGVFLRFLRRLPVFLGVALVIFSGVVGYTLQATPTYTSAATLVITPQGTDVLKDEVTGAPADSATVDTQVQVLKSRTLAKRVVQQLHLVQ